MNGLSRKILFEKEKKKMFKRLTAIALILTLLCVSALADVGALSYTQEEKLLLQLERSGFQAALTFSMSGTPSGMDENTAALLQTILPNLTLNYTRTVRNGYQSNGTENLLSATLNTETLLQTGWWTDANNLAYVQSNLLDQNGTVYAFDRSFDLSGFLADGTDKDTWPSILHVLWTVNNADADWQQRAESAISSYKTAVTLWMQSYASTQTERTTDGGYITTIAYSIPSAAILQEAKQLLVDFFSDSQLLSLLREVLSTDEQAAYLQPSMLLSFLQMIDNVKLDGSIEIKRQYDVTGASLYESVYLPFAETFPLSSLTIVRLPQETGDSWRVTGEMREEVSEGLSALKGITFDVSAESAEDGIWTGAVALHLPDAENYSVSADEQDGMDVSFTYNLNLPTPVDTADTYNNRYERSYESVLLIKPDESMGIGPQSIQLSASIYSKSSAKTSITYLDGALTWTDMNTGAAISANLDGRTAVAWVPTQWDSATADAVRIDLMNSEEGKQLVQAILSNLETTLSSLFRTDAATDTPLHTLPPQDDDGSVG